MMFAGGSQVSQAIYRAPPYRLIYLRCTDCLITGHVGTGRINYQHNAANFISREILQQLSKFIINEHFADF